MDTHQNGIRSPWRDLLYLMLYSLVVTFVFQVIIVLFGVLLSGDLSGVVGGENSLLESSAVFRYCLFASSSIGTFLLPVIWLQRTNREVEFYTAQRTSDWRNYVGGAAIMIAFIPFMDLIAQWNMEMSLPGGLKQLEQWMRTQEDNASAITASIIMVSSIDKLLLNLLVIAVLPGIAEEFFFRGALQNIFTRIFGNIHLSIWVVGIIFSAIHLQFYGFFPRMMLGVFLGYLLFWTGNIWVPIFVHFLNNASVVVAAFFYTRKGKSYEEFVSEGFSYSIIAYLGSLIFSILLGIAMYRYTQSKKRYAGRLD